MNGRVAGAKMKTVGEGSCKWPYVRRLTGLVALSQNVLNWLSNVITLNFARSATTAVRLSSSLLSASWWRWSETFSNIQGENFSGRIPHMLVVGTREFARSLMPGS